jgi:hypothetical protein
MDPYLEHPTLWPDVHNGLVAAIRDALGPLVAPRYIVALERRVYLFSMGDLELIGIPPSRGSGSWSPAVRSRAATITC